MKAFIVVGTVGLSVALLGCNQQQEQAAAPPAAEAPAAAAPDAMPGMPMGQAPAADAAAQTYTTTGEVTAVAGDSVTISHQPVAALNWPAMSMAFRAPDAAMIQGLTPGAQVRFSFRQGGTNYVLTQIERQ